MDVVKTNSIEQNMRFFMQTFFVQKLCAENGPQFGPFFESSVSRIFASCGVRLAQTIKTKTSMFAQWKQTMASPTEDAIAYLPNH